MASTGTSQDDANFRQGYAKSLADALVEREDAPKEGLLHNAYVALCHDDPRVESDQACRLLASALVSDDSPYRLSERLVEGIRQATGRTSTREVVSNPETEVDEDEEIVWLPGGVATAAGYASIAVASFITIPLRCCQSSDMAVVNKYLGSYRGPERRREELGEHMEAHEERSSDDQEVQNLAAGLSAMTSQDSDGSESDRGKDDNLIEEVWAAESDPSDYEYESSYNPQQALRELDQWTDAFDPLTLSKPLPSKDWTELQQAVANLLSNLSYSKLSALSKQQWKALNVSNLLSDLTLTLLLQPENDSTSLLNEELQQLGTQPLSVLRDRVAAQHDVLGDYLTLIQTLIAVDAAGPMTSKSSLAPATMVGLGALSALCDATHHGQAEAPQRIRQCVLETCEDLAHVMERAGYSAVHVTWTLLPLLDRLTNVRPHGTLWESSPLTNADAQLLLQSGMFRELIMLYTGSENEETARVQLLRSIQIMCVQSTSLLGKYAWRVPELAKLVQTDEFAQEHAVDGLVWNLLGTALAGSVRLQLKNMPVVTTDQCRERSLDCFERLGQDAEHAIETIKRLRESGDDKSGQDDQWKKSVHELSRFSNYLVSCTSLATLWRNAVTADDESSARVKSAIDSLRNALSNLPRVPDSVSKPSTEKSADNDKAGDPVERPTATGEQEEASIRKSIKVLSVSWQPQAQGRESLSSKTD